MFGVRFTRVLRFGRKARTRPINSGHRSFSATTLACLGNGTVAFSQRCKAETEIPKSSAASSALRYFSFLLTLSCRPNSSAVSGCSEMSGVCPVGARSNSRNVIFLSTAFFLRPALRWAYNWRALTDSTADPTVLRAFLFRTRGCGLCLLSPRPFLPIDELAAGLAGNLLRIVGSAYSFPDAGISQRDAGKPATRRSVLPHPCHRKSE